MGLAINALIHDRAALLFVATMGLLGGLAMVLAHNVWSGGPIPVIVTLIGSWQLIRNVLLLFLPAEAVVAIVDALQVERFSYLYALTCAGFSLSTGHEVADRVLGDQVIA